MQLYPIKQHTDIMELSSLIERLTSIKEHRSDKNKCHPLYSSFRSSSIQASHRVLIIL